MQTILIFVHFYKYIFVYADNSHYRTSALTVEGVRQITSKRQTCYVFLKIIQHGQVTKHSQTFLSRSINIFIVNSINVTQTLSA